MKCKLALAILLALLNTSVAQAQFMPGNAGEKTVDTVPGAMPGYDIKDRLARVDQMASERVAELGIPGYALVVIANGQVVFQKCYGFADLQSRRPVDGDTVFGLASMTKTFTAITLLSLVEKGLINLDDPLAKYLPDLTPPYENLTIRQLASMTAGVPTVLSKEVRWKDQLPILVNTPLQSQPGAEFHYSNFSYRLLGSVIARVTGRDYLDVVRETILGPLNMSSTATTFLLRDTGRVAQGYGDGSGELRAIEYKNPAVAYSAGMLASTQNDMIKYVLGMLNQAILPPNQYQTLWTIRPPLSTGQPSPWAFGWSSNTSQMNQLKLAMNGGTAGVASTVMLLPQSKSAVIALSNLRKPPVYQIAKKAFAIAFGHEDSEEPKEAVNSTDSGAD